MNTPEEFKQDLLNFNIGSIHNFLFLIYFSHLGLIIYELSMTRLKNYTFSIIKNTIASGIAILSWWLIGNGFMNGDSKNNIIGLSKFAESNFDRQTSIDYTTFVLTGGIMVISLITILMSVNERLDIHTVCLYSFLYSCIMFPIAACWTINKNGWLKEMKYIDYTGVGYVHLTAAGSSIALNLIVGRRLYRYSNKYDEYEFKSSSSQYLYIGMLILFLSRLGYNNSCILNILNNEGTYEYDIINIGRTSMNTIISSCSSALISFLLSFFMSIIQKSKERYCLLTISNGFLAGLISVSTSPHSIHSWAACVIGTLTGFIYYFYSWVTRRIRIDDPLEVIAVNLSGGSFGLIVVGWFDYNKGTVYGNNVYQFGIQVLGMVVYLFWGFISSGIVFFVFRLLKIHRINESIEVEGADKVRCRRFDFNLDEKSGEEYLRQLTINKEKKVGKIMKIEGIIQSNMDKKEFEIKSIPVRKEMKADVDDEINLDIIENNVEASHDNEINHKRKKFESEKELIGKV